MSRTRYQSGSLRLTERKKGKASEFRWREVQSDGSARPKNPVTGALEEHCNECTAQSAVYAIRLTVNQQSPRHLLRALLWRTLSTITASTTSRILPEPETSFRKCGRGRKSYSTQYANEVYLNKWILPRWKSCRISDVKAVHVEAWLKAIPLAPGSNAKIRNIMSASFSHAMRWVRHAVARQHPDSYRAPQCRCGIQPGDVKLENE
jgi:hypothetical protein